MSEAGIDFYGIKAKLMEDPEFRKEYDALQEEYDKVMCIIDVFNVHGKLYDAQRKGDNK